MTETKIITDFRPPKGYTLALEKRDYSTHPLGYCSSQFKLPLIDRSEWRDRIEEKKKHRARLGDLREVMGPNGKRIPSTNQGRSNFCWAYSTTSATIITRALQGQPYVALSGSSIACKITNFRNVGGWGANSLEYATQHGIARTADWPEGTDGIRRDLDMPQVWETAKQFRIKEWMDLNPRDIDQLMACLLRDIPVVSDFSWWRHSVCTLDAVNWDGRQLETDIWNSWGDNWGTNGLGRLQGSKAIPDGMVAPLAVEVG